MPERPAIVIVNPVAGGGRAGKLVPWLRDAIAGRPEVELAVTAAAGDATRLASEAAGGGRHVVSVGGDGTLQEIVNGLLAGGAGVPPTVGIVPAGSGNDLSRSLGLSRQPRRALAVALDGRPAAFDVPVAIGAAGRRHFVSAGGLGYDAQVAAAMADRRAWQRGRSGYLLTALNELRRFANARVRIGLDGEAPDERTVLMVAIANGAYYGGGMRICPDARTDDGVLDLCVVGDVGRLTALQQLPRLYPGRHVDHPKVEMLRARRIRVEGDGSTRVHLDGELFGTLPIAVEVAPAAIRVLV